MSMNMFGHKIVKCIKIRLKITSTHISNFQTPLLNYSTISYTFYVEINIIRFALHYLINWQIKKIALTSQNKMKIGLTADKMFGRIPVDTIIIQSQNGYD